MKELSNLRKSNAKYYLKNNGNIEAHIYLDNIHYLKNNKYLNIIDTLKKYNTNYQNINPNFKVILSNNNNRNLLTIKNDSYYIKIDLINKNINNITKDKNTLIYKDILPNISLKYVVLNNKLKDYIILNKGFNIKNIKYTIDTNLDIELLDNIIYFKDKDKIIFKELRPNIIDNIGNTFDIKYFLTKEDNLYYLSFDINNNISDNYPLIIDPVITSNNVSSTYISKTNSDSNYNTLDKLICGASTSDTFRSLLKFDLPSIGTSSNVVNAYINLYTHKDDYSTEKVSYEGSLSIHEIMDSIDFNSVTWNTFDNKYNEEIIDYTSILRSVLNNNIISLNNNIFNITYLVKKWYSGTANNGVLIRNENEEDTSIPPFSFYSDNSNYTPYLAVEYKNINGIEDYLSYQELNGNGYSSYINNLTGNITNIIPLSNTILSKKNINVSLVYNTNDLNNNDNHYINGFKLNIYSYIKIVDNDTLEYLDSDGTTHYFYNKDNIYYDEDNLNLEISKTNDTFILKDKYDNTYTFTNIDNIYYLTTIKDNLNNINTIYYQDNKIIKMVDSDNEEINITYNSNNIVVSSNYLTSTINIENNKINSISNKYGNVTLFYDNDVISSILDRSNQTITFSYYDISKKIKKIKRIGLNGVEGESLEFTYNFNSTSIKDNKGLINVYTFNSYGNTINITSKPSNGIDSFFGINKTYGESTNKNKLLLITPTLKYTNSLFFDGTFEEHNLSDEGVLTTKYSHYGNKSLEVNTETKITLPAISESGYYTFSGYFKNSSYMELSIKNSSSTVSNFYRIPYNENFTRQTITCYLEANTQYYLNIFPINNATIC